MRPPWLLLPHHTPLFLPFPLFLDLLEPLLLLLLHPVQLLLQTAEVLRVLQLVVHVLLPVLLLQQRTVQHDQVAHSGCDVQERQARGYLHDDRGDRHLIA